MILFHVCKIVNIVFKIVLSQSLFQTAYILYLHMQKIITFLEKFCEMQDIRLNLKIWLIHMITSDCIFFHNRDRVVKLFSKRKK